MADAFVGASIAILAVEQGVAAGALQGIIADAELQGADVDDGDDDSEHQWLPQLQPHAGQSVSQPGVLEGVQAVEVASESSSGSFGPEGGAHGEAAGDGSEAPAPPPFKRLREDNIRSIDGVDIVEEIFNEHGGADEQRYHRISVRCPLTSTCHIGGNPCRRHRSIAESTTRHFGRVEAVGFLGCWLRNRDRFATRAARMAYRPSVGEIEAYLIHEGLL